jgi:glucose/arabinose dehydrogenase
VPGVAESVVASGINRAVQMDFAPDGRLFVTELDGKVRVIKNGAKLSTPFMSIKVDRYNNRGLIGLTFDPNFASNRYLYVFYSRPDLSNPDVQNNSTKNRVSRRRRARQRGRAPR